MPLSRNSHGYSHSRTMHGYPISRLSCDTTRNSSKRPALATPPKMRHHASYKMPPADASAARQVHKMKPKNYATPTWDKNDTTACPKVQHLTHFLAETLQIFHYKDNMNHHQMMIPPSNLQTTGGQMNIYFKIYGL